AWDEVQREGRDPEAGYNVVVHEFAHQLDFVDGVSLGTPRLGDPAREGRWRYVMAVAFADHRRAIREGGETFFTPHAAEHGAEFVLRRAPGLRRDRGGEHVRGPTLPGEGPGPRPDGAHDRRVPAPRRDDAAGHVLRPQHRQPQAVRIARVRTVRAPGAHRQPR